jgi:putative peptidoglycan lipid II flippase
VKDTLRFSVGLLAFVTIPATAGLMLLATPVIRLLFEYGRFDAHSTELTVFALYFHAAGIFFIAMQRNVVQVFYAMKDMRTPTWIAAVVMVVNIVLSFALAGPLRQGGIAAAGSIAAAVNVALLYVILRGRIGRLQTRALVRSLARTCTATAAMAATVMVPLLLGAFDGVRGATLALRLLPAIGAGLVVYVGVAWALRSDELTEFAALVRRKVGGGRGR